MTKNKEIKFTSEQLDEFSDIISEINLNIDSNTMFNNLLLAMLRDLSTEQNEVLSGLI